MSDSNANTESPSTADRLQAKTIVYFSSHSYTDSLQFHMKRAHPETRFIVLPIVYGGDDVTKQMKEDLIGVLKTTPVDAVVFDTAKCAIDAVIEGATNPVNPILPQNRALPVVLFTGADMNKEKTRVWVTHSMDCPVPKAVSKVVMKPVKHEELCNELADVIEQAQERQR